MHLLDFVFPKRCLSCGKIGRYFCDRCRREIGIIGTRGPANGALDGLISFFRYDGVVREAIKALKYRFVFDLAAEFIDLIPSSSLPVFPSSILVPVPLHPSRLRYRGFNQAELLGKLIAEKLHIPMRRDILIRTRKTAPQVEMKDRKKRLKNTEGVFAISPHLPILLSSDLSIVLFDDVFTTGATMRSAASVLKRAEARQVWGITMAR